MNELEPASLPDGDMLLRLEVIHILGHFLENGLKQDSEAIPKAVDGIMEACLRNRNAATLDFLRTVKEAEHLEPKAYKRHIMQAVETAAEIVVEDLGMEL